MQEEHSPIDRLSALTKKEPEHNKEDSFTASLIIREAKRHLSSEEAVTILYDEESPLKGVERRIVVSIPNSSFHVAISAHLQEMFPEKIPFNESPKPRYVELQWLNISEKIYGKVLFVEGSKEPTAKKKVIEKDEYIDFWMKEGAFIIGSVNSEDMSESDLTTLFRNLQIAHPNPSILENCLQVLAKTIKFQRIRPSGITPVAV